MKSNPIFREILLVTQRREIIKKLSGLIANKRQIRVGVIIIADISGFTKFVTKTDFFVGRYIIQELLSTIIETNKLEFNVSEIEGDAVLFYRFGIPPSLNSIINQFEDMSLAFHQKLEQINKTMDAAIELSLKLIAHYGEIAEYSINKFTKLYGRPVIEAHCLLKNEIQSEQYLLITDELKMAAKNAYTENYSLKLDEFKRCDFYKDLRNISYSYIPYDTNNRGKHI